MRAICIFQDIRRLPYPTNATVFCSVLKCALNETQSQRGEAIICLAIRSDPTLAMDTRVFINHFITSIGQLAKFHKAHGLEFLFLLFRFSANGLKYVFWRLETQLPNSSL